MYIKSNRFNLVFRIIYLIICGAGIIGHLSKDDRIQNINMLSYFTIQSNIVCFLVMLCSIYHSLVSVKRRKYHDYARIHIFLKGMALLVITITFLTYNLLLTGRGFAMVDTGRSRSWLSVNDMIVHFVVPALTWIEFLVFQPKGGFRFLDPLRWLMAPVAYFLFIMIRAGYMTESVGGIGIRKYPYYFLDVERYGVEFVIKYVLLFATATLITGYIIRTIDFILGMIYTKVQKFRLKRRNNKR